MYYSLLEDPTRYLGLTADDVNMVKMGMTGADRDAGTPDDYIIQSNLCMTQTARWPTFRCDSGMNTLIRWIESRSACAL